MIGADQIADDGSVDRLHFWLPPPSARGGLSTLSRNPDLSSFGRISDLRQSEMGTYGFIVIIGSPFCERRIYSHVLHKSTIKFLCKYTGSRNWELSTSNRFSFIHKMMFGSIHRMFVVM